MGKLETALKAEIARLSRRETKQLIAKHVDEIKKLRKRVISLERELDTFRTAHKQEQTKRKVKQAVQTVASDDAPQPRLSAKQVRTLRKRLNLSQADLAKLVGVSSVTVGNWESEKTKPRPAAKARVAALRRLGRRDVKRLLAQ